MNRVVEKFKELKRKRRKALIVYITAGYPSLSQTVSLIKAFEKCGVDIIEIGIPFSDPLADGPTIQKAGQYALEKGATLPAIIKAIKRAIKETKIPLVAMTYYNPVFAYGIKRFVRDAKAAGIDGVIVPDLPPEEAGELILASRKNDFATIFLAAPTSTEDRLKLVANASTGFIYYVSVTGITGAREKLPPQMRLDVKRIKRLSPKPVCVGFGISNKSQAREIASFSDGVIIGSAIINAIGRYMGRKDFINRMIKFVKGFADATHI